MVSLQIYRMGGKWEVRAIVIKSAAEGVFPIGVPSDNRLQGLPFEKPRQRSKTLTAVELFEKPQNVNINPDKILSPHPIVNLGMNKIWIILLFSGLLQQCTYSQNQQAHSNKSSFMDSTKKNNPVYSNTDTGKVILSEEEWKKILSPEVYQIARQKGTERPWTSIFEHSKEIGTYYCAACGNPLFKSDTKFDSGCGWPSFYEPITKGSIIYTPDNTHGMQRTEVQCGRCKAHLGHVFDDGPPPTGLRYCINGVVLDFQKAKEAEKDYNKKNN